MCKDFFQYETKLGRKLIRVPTRSSLIRKAKAQQIRSRNHSHYINKIWKGRWSAKNCYFMWLAQQERLPSLVAIHLPNTACKTCGATETQRHILWECPAAQEVWEGAAAVLKRTSTGGAAITYESALWGALRCTSGMHTSRDMEGSLHQAVRGHRPLGSSNYLKGLVQTDCLTRGPPGHADKTRRGREDSKGEGAVAVF
ncbi:hypothetical protein SELMODRAFT_425091 [Selaginella moellendorffii]|uniref:Reverse transcriptase zinc-binding domain-containing protein n=1 Tax=Selaginella moellendorffii TaxID=88036 RepID=D8SS01_SELML|nr:hypothetical protein SELMODRAFT_425091 [Selaginella moellendorffii]